MRPLAIPRVCNQSPCESKQSIDRCILGIGPAVLLANWTRNDTVDNSFSVAAYSQLSYLLNYSPHTSDGAISQRTAQVQLWYREVPWIIDDVL